MNNILNTNKDINTDIQSDVNVEKKEITSPNVNVEKKEIKNSFDYKKFGDGTQGIKKDLNKDYYGNNPFSPKNGTRYDVGLIYNNPNDKNEGIFLCGTNFPNLAHLSMKNKREVAEQIICGKNCLGNTISK